MDRRCARAVLALAWLAALAACTPMWGAGGERGFRVVTYNVGLGLGYRLPMALPTSAGPDLRWALRHHVALRQPDILALQEVCLTAGPQLNWLVRAMQLAHGTAWIWQAHATDGGQFDSRCSCAQVTLSRWPITASGRLELPLLSWRNAVLWTDHDIRGVDAPWNATGRLRVYNLHLINRVGTSVHVPEARWQQALAVLAHHDAFRRRDPQTPVLWVGDFNTLDHLLTPWRRERVVRELAQRMVPAMDGFHPTHVLVQQVDWIFADRMPPQRAQTVLLPLSDHLPVVADY